LVFGWGNKEVLDFVQRILKVKNPEKLELFNEEKQEEIKSITNKYFF